MVSTRGAVVVAALAVLGLVEPNIAFAQCTINCDLVRENDIVIRTDIPGFPSSQMLLDMKLAIEDGLRRDSDLMGLGTSDVSCCYEPTFQTVESPLPDSCDLIDSQSEFDSCAALLPPFSWAIIERLGFVCGGSFGPVSCQAAGGQVLLARTNNRFAPTDFNEWARHVLFYWTYEDMQDLSYGFNQPGADIFSSVPFWFGQVNSSSCNLVRDLSPGFTARLCACVPEKEIANGQDPNTPHGEICGEGTPHPETGQVPNPTAGPGTYPMTCDVGTCTGPPGDPGCLYRKFDTDNDTICQDGDGNGRIFDGTICKSNQGRFDQCDDNCPDFPNTDQLNGDPDGQPAGFPWDKDDFGNACDLCPKFMGHDLATCPLVVDSDADGLDDVTEDQIGTNALDADSDGDGVRDNLEHLGADGVFGSADDSDPLDTDTDNDGVLDGIDNCRSVANAAQADGDADGAGDACDVCPSISDPGQHDQDFDLVGDACDNCLQKQNPRVPSNFLSQNPWATTTGGQRDDNGNGWGNKCDGKFAGPTSGLFVSGLDSVQLLASLGGVISNDNCGVLDDQPCAIFDVDEDGLLIIGGLDSNYYLAHLLGKSVSDVPTQKCANCPMACAGDNC